MPARIRYLQPPYESRLYQGDVIEGIPILVVPANVTRWTLLRAPQDSGLTKQDVLRGKRPRIFLPRAETDVADAWSDATEAVVAKATKTPVMIVTQTCDLDHRKYVQVVPIRPASQLSSAKQESLRKEEIEYQYYLPAKPGVLADDCYADLQYIVPVHQSYFADAKVLCRLTNAERSRVQRALSHFHSSPFGFVPGDSTERAGVYGCLSCFLSGAHVVQTLGVGVFPECAGCGGLALWLLLNDGGEWSR